MKDILYLQLHVIYQIHMISTEDKHSVPQTDHDHNEQGIYIGIHVYHVFVFVRQEHGHQNKEPVLFLPANSTW